MIVENIIIIDGKEYNFEELSQEKRKEIAIALNDRALGRLGYVRVEEDEQTE